MDPFASYAALDNPQQFWAELDDILDIPFHPPPPSSSSHPSTSIADAEALLHAKRIYTASVLAKFLHLCAASFNDNLSSEYNQDYCISRLFSSTAFHDDADPSPAAADDPTNIAMHQLAAEEAIRIMQTSTSIPVLLMTYEIVLQYGDAFPSTYKSVQASASTVSFVGLRAFLHRLVHQIWAGSYAAQAEAKIGISEQQQQQSGLVGWNGAHWDQQDTYQQDQQERASSSTTPAPTSTATYISRALTSSSASKHIAIQISLREKAVRMLYEVCRVQKLEPSHLKAFDERFIHHLFDLVEETRHHDDEDFNYRLIKLLVAVNEQYMVSTLTLTSTASASSSAANVSGQVDSTTPTHTRPVNLVLSVLQQRLNASKTFGENVIFMLNRASSSDAEDVCMQLLLLKLLYLLFTTKATACYFYTNDLRVLVDIFIRKLHDLPDESESLRHTYLRVLHPLLTNTQLCTYPYKRPQIRRLLDALLAHAHLRDISPTTRRLVDRCLRAEWCVELDRLDGTERTAKVEPIGGGQSHIKVMQPAVTSEGLPMLATKINENSGSVQATANSLAATTEEEGVSPVSIDTTLSATSLSLDSASEPPRASSGSASLSVPSTLPTRDKRVASLSNHPRSPLEDTPPCRPTSAAALSSATGSTLAQNRRALSACAQSAPWTSPSVDSPGLRQTSRLSEVGAEKDDALSTASSWHAHLLEDAPAQLGKVEGGKGSHFNQHQKEAEARVASPLVSASTFQVLSGGGHSGEGSDSTITASCPVGTGMNPTPPAGEAPKRRKPPQPPTCAATTPTAARRAMQLSSSEPHFSHNTSSPNPPRSASPYPASASSTPANQDAGQPGGAKGSVAIGGGRRRPPPPPPPSAVSQMVQSVQRQQEEESAS
ncbi:related to LDB17 - protein involved in the regulation of endocytosis [Ustilago sp. UG-2017a]|nr:related to LDB17 - protein involved in the regulation of endocytosis [Ustilago sp. UG-2017a]